MMHKQSTLLWLALGIMTASAGAQVTTDGSTSLNTVPYFKNSTTQLSNSPIMVSGSSVGIGTPSSPDGRFFIDGSANTWTANSWIKDLMLYGVGAIEFRGDSTTKYGMANSGNTFFFFDTTADDNSAPANYRMVIQSGNVGIGTTAPASLLSVGTTSQFQVDPHGVVTTTGGVTTTSVTFSSAPPGQQTQTMPWTGVLCGGDYAEAVDPAGDLHSYGPGDVLVITDDEAGGDVRKSSEPYSTMVAGIYATKPGVVGRRESLPKDAQDLPMAMVGIAPTKVTTENGPIHRGDLLVTSARAGYAMKGTDRSRMLGAVIGKSMGSLDQGSGVVEVLVTLQ